MKNILSKLKQPISIIKKILKEQTPNIITTARGAMAAVMPFIFSGRNPFVIIPTIIATLSTDFVDGFLARRWGVPSKYGAKADQIADKLFGVSVMASLLIFLNPVLAVTLSLAAPLFLEVTMIGGYLYFNKIKKIKDDRLYKTAKIGRVKTAILAVATILATLACFCSGVNYAVYPLLGLTVLAQGATNYVYAKRIFGKNKQEENIVAPKPESIFPKGEKIIALNSRQKRIEQWKRFKEKISALSSRQERIKLLKRLKENIKYQYNEYLEIPQIPVISEEKNKAREKIKI